MSADKRSVTTDALATLGTIITNGGRDAIHLAVEPVIAGEHLWAGQHIGLVDGKATTKVEKKLGIVDPFVQGVIPEGSKFWLIVYPRQITSLRHVWEHPEFDQKGKDIESEVDKAQAWIQKFAEEINQTYNRLMEAADLWVESDDGNYGGEYTYDNSERYKDHWEKFPVFWEHYEIVRGKAPKTKSSFFTCSC